MKSTVSVVVLNWNGAEVTPACLRSLAKQTVKPSEIIVIDNGSTDGSADIIEKEFTNVKLIREPKNLGFAGGVNVGIKASKSDYVMLLNSDAEAEPRCIENLLKTANKTNADIVQAVILTDKGKRIDSVGDVYTIWGLPFPGGRNQSSKNVPTDDQKIFSASGGASMYKKSLFNEIGYFDEMFFAYYEDVDISMRAQLLGKEIWLSSNAIVQHRMNFSFNKIKGLGRELTIRNSIYLFWKNLPFPLIAKVFPRFLYANWRMTAAAMLKGHFWRAVRAHFVALWHTPHLLVRRIRIQKNKKLSSKEFEDLLSRDNPFTAVKHTKSS